MPNNNPVEKQAQAQVVTWGHPLQTEVFVGREDLLKKLHESFTGVEAGQDEKANQEMVHIQNGLKITACVGLGGTGTTQLALQYSHQTQRPYTLKAWFSADSVSILEQEYTRFANEVLGSEEASIEDTQQYVKQHLKMNPSWLLIFDNAESYENIAPFLPKTGGHVLITTRTQLWPSSHVQMLPVDVMTEKDAIDWVRGAMNLQDQDAEIQSLVAALQYLPWAINQAIAYMQHHQASIIEYTVLYDKYRKEELVYQTLPFGAKRIPVAITLDISLDAISEEQSMQSLASRFLTVCAYLGPRNISYNFMSRCLELVQPSPNEQNAVFAELISLFSRYSLIQVDERRQSFSISCLVQTIVRYQHQRPPFQKLIDNPEWYDTLLERMGEEFEGLLGDEKRKNSLPQLQALVFHHQFLWSDKPRPRVARILNYIGTLFIYQGLYENAKSYCERALSIQEQSYGKEDKDVATILATLGIVYQNLGEPKKQRELLERALSINERHHGRNHVSLVSTLENLSDVCGELGDVRKKKEFLERVLSIAMSHYGKVHQYVANTLFSLSHICGLLNEVEKKKELLEDLLSIEEMLYIEEPIKVVPTLETLANIYRDLKYIKEAKALLERGCLIKENFYGKESMEVAEILGTLADVCRDLKYTKQAKELLERTHSIIEGHYGKESMEVADILKILADFYWDLKYTRKTKELLEQVLFIKELHCKERKEEVAATLLNLAVANSTLGNKAEGVKIAKRAYNILCERYGVKHVETEHASNLLADLSAMPDEIGDLFLSSTSPLALNILEVGREIVQTDSLIFSAQALTFSSISSAASVSTSPSISPGASPLGPTPAASPLGPTSAATSASPSPSNVLAASEQNMVGETQRENIGVEQRKARCNF